MDIKKKNQKNNKNRIHFLLLGLIIVATILMGIGYAASSMLLEVDGSAVAVVSNTIEITNAVLSSSNNANTANSSITSYFNTNLNSTVELNNDSASQITYAVTVYNNLGSAKAYKDTTPPYTTQTNFYDNTGIKYEVTGITKGEVLANQGSKTFYVTFSYANGVSANKVLHSILTFNFDDYYTITYSNITGFTSETIIAGDNLVVNFGNNAPSSVTVVGSATYVAGTDYTYSNGTLTINGVSENITVTGASGGGQIEGGTYDPDDPPQSGTYIYSNSPGDPVVVYDNGIVTSFEFSDTSGTDVSAAGGIDTGYVAFNGNDFIVRMHGKMPISTNSSNNGIALDIHTSDQTKVIQLGVMSKKYFRVWLKAPGYNGSTAANSQYTVNQTNDEFDIEITYVDHVITIKNYLPNPNNPTTIVSRTNDFNVTGGVDVLVGYTLSNGNPARQAADLTVYEFYIGDYDPS